MIITEQGVTSPIQSQILRGMFEARKAVFVDLLKWDVPVLEGCFEVDQFDTAEAVYVIVADQDGAHLGSARLLPTTRPHILGDLYPDLCQGKVPRGPNIWEITRFCLDRRQDSRTRRHTRNCLVTALVEVALNRGIDTYTGVAELAWLQQILAFGWDCRPLGVPVSKGRCLLGGLRIAIDHQTPSLLDEQAIWAAALPASASLAEAA